jgi:hypothetical protein
VTIKSSSQTVAILALKSFGANDLKVRVANFPTSHEMSDEVASTLINVRTRLRL